MDPIEDRVIYDAVWRACQAALLKHGATVDKATKDPARFSRAGGGIREKGKEQKIMKIVGRTNFSDLEGWLKRNDIDWQDYLPKQEFKPAYIMTEHSASNNDLKWDWIEKYYMKNDEYVDSNKHNYQVKMAYLLLRTGMSAGDIDSMFVSKFGEVSTGIGSVKTFPTTNLGEAIYVPSMAERKEYYKQLELQNKDVLLHQRYNTPDVPKTDEGLQTIESIDRYIRVGTEYYKTDIEKSHLILWNKSTFQDDYGTGTIPPRCYDAFSYLPDYTSENEPIELGNNLQYRNHFQRPSWKLEGGSWPTIESALRHAFNEQYELALQYCAVSILYPTQPLPIIIFQGEENVGKSATIKIFQYLLGEKNCKTINTKMFESAFDGYLMNTQLLTIEEAGQWEDDRAAADEFKRLVTEIGDIEINPKYGRQTTYPWYGKIMCTSNDLSPLRLEGSASRFWVRELFKLNSPVTDYYNKIKKEMGAFVNYLIHVVGANLPHPNERPGRLYFEPEEYWTSAKEFMKDFSKPQTYFKLMEFFEDFFEKTDEDILYFDLKSLKNRWVDFPGEKQVKALLAREFGIKEKSNNLERPDGLNFVMDIYHNIEIPKRKTGWYSIDRKTVTGMPNEPQKILTC